MEPQDSHRPFSIKLPDVSWYRKLELCILTGYKYVHIIFNRYILEGIMIQMLTLCFIVSRVKSLFVHNTTSRPVTLTLGVG